MYSSYSSSYFPLAQAYYDIGARRSRSEDRFTSAYSEASASAKRTRALSAEPSISKGYSSRYREYSPVFSSYDLLRSSRSSSYYNKSDSDSYSYSPSTYSRKSYTPSYSSYYAPYYSSAVYSPYYSRYTSPYSSSNYSYSNYRSAATYLSAYNPFYSGYIPLTVRYPYSSGRIYA